VDVHKTVISMGTVMSVLDHGLLTNHAAQVAAHNQMYHLAIACTLQLNHTCKVTRKIVGPRIYRLSSRVQQYEAMPYYIQPR
jgi:hypothetical protein